MLVPLSWLKKYVKIDIPVDEFVRRMIMSGTAVEGYEDCGAEVKNVVVGRLTEIVPHPNSDHLHICMVDVGGEEPIQIVCGAPNVHAGMRVAAALDGAVAVAQVHGVAMPVRQHLYLDVPGGAAPAFPDTARRCQSRPWPRPSPADRRSPAGRRRRSDGCRARRRPRSP